VIALFTARKAVRSGIIWGYIFGASIASSAISYTKLYKTVAERDALATAFGSNKATSALFGPAPQLQTVGGFTVFKISMTLLIMGAVWGILTSTKLLRGEEDNGRWDLLLAGPTTRSRATLQALGGLGAGVFALWALTALITVVVGLDSAVDIAFGAALYFSLCMVATAVMFLAVGAVASQLAATRRQAASYAATFLGLAYGVRLIADAGVGLHWLIWISPLGWVEELRPLTAPHPSALIPIVVLTAVLAFTAVRLAGSRDVGASVFPDRTHSEPHLRLLFGPTGLAIRTLRATVLGWWVAIAVSAAMYGLIAKSAGATISGSSVEHVFSKLGAQGTGAAAVLGVCFLILAILVAFVAAGQLTAARSEESEGRLDHVLVGPVSRARWLAGRLVVAGLTVLASGAIAGLACWFGAASQHAGVSLATLLDAGVNLVPPAIAIGGIGVLAFGIRPRSTSVVVHALLGWSILIVVVGGIGDTSHWILDTSVFHHMASAPAVSPHWEANGLMAGLGLLSATLGLFAFRRRDMQGE
jgi:ABC-2 type transport system permease protein